MTHSIFSEELSFNLDFTLKLTGRLLSSSNINLLRFSLIFFLLFDHKHLILCNRNHSNNIKSVLNSQQEPQLRLKKRSNAINYSQYIMTNVFKNNLKEIGPKLISKNSY